MAAHPLDTAVLIVGAGPVGLAIALELGWRGIDCILIEQGDGSIPTPKMNEVNIRTMEFCRRWGIAEAVMHCPFPDDYPMDVVIATRLGGRELGRIERPARRAQRANPHSPMNLQVCSQHWFDPILRERADSFESVNLLYRTRLESFVESADGVEAVVVDLGSGQKRTLQARYLVGTDGASSPIRRQLGIGLAGSPVLSHSMHLFFRTPDLLGQLGVRPGTFFSMIDRQGLWGNVRAIDPASGLWRLLFDVPEGTEPADIDRDAWLQRAIARPVDVEWVGASKWTRRGVVAEQFSKGRVFLAGDAVHQVSPTGALGMNTGIADAVDLGWKLAATIEGWGGPRLLDSYDAERRPASARNVRMATQYYEGQAQFQGDLSAIEADSPDGEALRSSTGAAAVAHITRVFRTLGLQIGYRYEDSPVIVADGSPAPIDDPAEYVATARPGARAPHVPLVDGRSTLDLFGRGFVLLNFGDSAADLDASWTLADLARERGMPFTISTVTEPRARVVYENRLVLVRPDGHVAWRGDTLPDDPVALIDRVRGA
jgi:2-polyprenyl-6-methoxyphenol hydroxylase-like FAD-dependent oxidoreductase